MCLTSGKWCALWRSVRWRPAVLVALLALAALLWWVQPADYEIPPVAGRELPLIFIDGPPHSGATLLRAMLDAHPDVRCGPETRVVPRILDKMYKWKNSKMEFKRLRQAGVTNAVLDSAIAAFCLQVIAGHGDPAPRLCDKDSLLLSYSLYLLQLFPNAQFVFMVRDGRAAVHSIISRNESVAGFDLSSYQQCFRKWNDIVANMYVQCSTLGAERCLLVHYEALVLRPRDTLRRVLDFLALPWHDAVLHHERYINQPNGVVLSNSEPASWEVVRPLHQDALGAWVPHFPESESRDIAELAPMLRVLGYNLTLPESKISTRST